MCDDTTDIATNDFDLDYTITATNTVPCTELLAEYNSALTSENSYEGLFIFFLLVTIRCALGVPRCTFSCSTCCFGNLCCSHTGFYGLSETLSCTFSCSLCFTYRPRCKGYCRCCL